MTTDVMGWTEDLALVEPEFESAPEPERKPLVMPLRTQAAEPDARYLYIDLETMPDESRESQFNLPPLPTEKPETAESDLMSHEEFLSQGLPEIRKSLLSLNPVDSWLVQLLESEQQAKKPRKGVIEAVDALKKERRSIANAGGDRRKAMATTPEMCRIVALGFAIDDGPVESRIAGVEGRNEESLLEIFWGLVQSAGKVVGFNVLRFDLPVLFVRSALLGVQPTRRLDLRPWSGDVIDLMDVRFPRSKATGLKALARMYDFDIPADGVSGEHVADLMATNPAAVGEYVRSDVDVTRQLHQFYAGYFC